MYARISSSHPPIFSPEVAATATPYPPPIRSPALLVDMQDWSPDDPAELATSSAGTGTQVKLWDINSPQSPKAAFDAGGDVIRVQYTPVGRGIVTSAALKVRDPEAALIRCHGWSCFWYFLLH